MKLPSQAGPIDDPGTRESEPPRAESRITPGMRFPYRGFTCSIDTITLVMPESGIKVEYYSLTVESGSDWLAMRGQMEMGPADAEQACQDMVHEILRQERRGLAA